MDQLLQLLLDNLELAVPVAVLGLELLLRKIPRALPLLRLLDKALDKLPGFKNIE